MTQMVTVENVIHYDALTPECICPRVEECEGVATPHARCPEHGLDSGPLLSIHSHNRRILKESRLRGS